MNLPRMGAMFAGIFTKALRSKAGQKAVAAATAGAIKAAAKHGPPAAKRTGAWVRDATVDKIQKRRHSRDSHIVRAYLDVLQGNHAEKVAKSVGEVADTVEKLHLIQRRLDSDVGAGDDAPREAFVRIAKSYSERNGVSYQAWREMGVPEDVLKESGVASPQ